MAKRGPRSITTTGCSSGARHIRCAVYTRKSTEEGLEQAFNSLDAQREACEAYIASQRHEGWQLDPALYDDGGYSGGTMERPALKRLLADVESGRIDVIVVYKVDRLTRALSDFAKIVEILDAKGASFVSVTQAFNTTTSMGRLTLNVLLSFAQFEREVTGERIRDKIAASKKKGMWMGGPVPLGYDVHERKLQINETEADIVRLIFRRHVALGSLKDLASEIVGKGMRSKLRTMRDGRVSGGARYSPGALAYLLRNVIYIGRIRHGDTVYEGEHERIIPAELWEASQALLSGKAVNDPRPRKGLISPLNGHLEDGIGRPMTSVHAIKASRRYRYYMSRPREGQTEAPWRLPAGDLETMVRQGITDLLNDLLRLGAELGDACMAREGGTASAELAASIAETPAFVSMLDDTNARIILQPDLITISLAAGPLAELIGGDASTVAADEVVTIELAVTLKRRGHELKLIYAAPDARPVHRDDRLIQLLASGRSAYQQLRAGRNVATRSHLVRMARLHFLVPDIITAILEGRQPVELTSRALLRAAEVPMDWREQRKVLGFN